MITKAECMAEAANIPLWGGSEKFTNVSISGFRKLQEGGATGTRETPMGKYISRPPIDAPISLYDFSRRSGEVPVFTGAAPRPLWPPNEAYARSIPLLHRPWRKAADLRAIAEDHWVPIFHDFLLSEGCPLSLKVGVARAKARRAQPVGVPWEGPTQDGVRAPSDSDEEDPRIYARDPGGADLDESDLADFRDYGDSFDRATVSPFIEEAGFPGADVAGTWLCARAEEFRKDGSGGPLDLPRREDGAAYDPYDANEAQRFQISIAMGEIRDWVGGRRITNSFALSHRA